MYTFYVIWCSCLIEQLKKLNDIVECSFLLSYYVSFYPFERNRVLFYTILNNINNIVLRSHFWVTNYENQFVLPIREKKLNKYKKKC